MLKDLALKYAQADYNCAESVIMAANEYYSLGVELKDIRLLSGFGAGMQCGDICGGLAGAIAAVSIKYVENRAHEDKPGLRNKVTKLIRNFEEELGSRQCMYIKPKYYNPEIRCQKTIMISAEILEKTIEEIDKELSM
ncbi:MAG: C-GCAxxG-C-C family (seleno)protein [Erysipelotrichaceae bacterium]|nr:C-GCAxxG-C-C family (seleno)protein [Erysipelotrichaceae bacterium]